jgi:membrane-bound metal-dependent hydrolase YbcI (DUF457 family)
MNFKQHATIGALAAGFVYLLYKLSKDEEWRLNEAVAIILLGAFAGVSADLLEPATNPNHRSVCHSGLALAMILLLCYKGSRTDKLSDSQKAFTIPILFAYASHLVADSTSPKSLPLIV